MSVLARLETKVIRYEAPACLQERQGGLLDALDVVDPTSMSGALGDCSICLCPLSSDEEEDASCNTTGNHEPPATAETGRNNTARREQGNQNRDEEVLRLKCDHAFHRKCLQHMIERHKPVCPVCRRPIRLPQGTCPSGSMTIEVLRMHCPGFAKEDGTPVDTIGITYQIHSGYQKSYHYHPGVRFSGTHRQAYLPNNRDGHELLARLVFGWKHGLIFTVGTSLTTNMPNSVVWTSIHHKTSLHGGPHGFPDPGYMYNCHESLDALYVPDAKSCQAMEAGTTTGEDCKRGPMGGGGGRRSKRLRYAGPY